MKEENNDDYFEKQSPSTLRSIGGLLTFSTILPLNIYTSIEEMAKNSHPHLMEIMPGVIGKTIRRFSTGSIPVIAGGLIQTKSEVTDALRCGAPAVSTGKSDLWYL